MGVDNADFTTIGRTRSEARENVINALRLMLRPESDQPVDLDRELLDLPADVVKRRVLERSADLGEFDVDVHVVPGRVSGYRAGIQASGESEAGAVSDRETSGASKRSQPGDVDRVDCREGLDVDRPVEQAASGELVGERLGVCAPIGCATEDLGHVDG
jgi:hypothetical protein